ncbi:hypothetical protein VFPPC_17623 [Pochonia chlamydosporia 170]|uniref:Uncharacterized protein n=1 Tax=Pochonia chlamydosporia 170 TaxID=1380566 RepID=A0A219AR15_METCM|nr:hypothetical protein VFPPC_17623 [Pochonia chlamydosporia 170]OWT43201.1 hypothetical protein VFPPC_17623 [Pochonia chlamydosporia 170]
MPSIDVPPNVIRVTKGNRRMPCFTTHSNEERLSLEKLGREYKLANRVAHSRELHGHGLAALLKNVQGAVEASSSNLEILAREDNAILELSEKHKAEIQQQKDDWEETARKALNNPKS